MTASFSSYSLVLGGVPTAVSMINGRTSMSRMMPSCQVGTGGFGGPVSRETLTTGLAAALGNGEVNAQTSSPGLYNDLLGIKPSDKENMQNLNARLATYLKTVHSLEATNARLEKQIRDFMQERLAKQGNDYSTYEKTISDLQTQVGIASRDRQDILLEITNAQLNLEDKKNAFQNEQDLRYQAERDVALLKTMLHTLSQTKTDLNVQVRSMQDEIDDLKSNHRREIEAISHLREEESITVQVEEVASTDLTNALADIRSEYENFISKQRRQTEAWSNSKMQATTFSQAMTKSGTDAQSSNSQVTNLTVQVQALEIELQLCHRMNKSLEDILQSTESSYSDKLREHQQRAAHLEDELHALRDDIQRQAQDYQVLLDIKNHLETEITDYRHLLDGQETSQKDLEMTAISNNCLPGLNSVQQSKMERDKAAEKEPKMDGLGESVVNLELEPCPEFDIHQELVLGLEVSTNSEQDLQKGPVISQELEPKPVYALATELEPNSKLKARSRSHSAPRMFYRQKERIRHSSCKNVELPLEVESATDVKVKLEPMVFLNAELECTAESSVSLDQNPDQKYEIDIVKSQESASSIDLDQEQQSELLPNQEFILEVKSSISMGSDPEQQSVIIRQGLKPEPASTLTAELEQEAESTIGLDLVSVAGQERELKLDPSINMEPDLQPENIISQEQLPAFVLKAQLEPESKPDINLELKSAQEPVVNIEFELEPESVRLQGLTPESQSAINVEHLE